MWLARHLPLLHGTASSRLGGSLYGLGMAARIVFDKPAEALDLAEQAVLAAAVKYHVLLAAPGDLAGRQLAEERWAGMVERPTTSVVRAHPAQRGACQRSP